MIWVKNVSVKKNYPGMKVVKAVCERVKIPIEIPSDEQPVVAVNN